MEAQRTATVAMLVYGDVAHDNRVQREAETVAALGHRVHVLSWPRDELAVAAVDGVVYERVDRPARRDRFHHWKAESQRLGAAYVDAKRRRDRARLLTSGIRLAQARAAVRWARLQRSVFLDRRYVAIAMKLRFSRAARDRLDELAPDVVHAHDLKTLFAARRHFARRGTPYVYDAHEFEVHSMAIKSRADRTIAWLFERYGIKRAAAVVTVSEQIADELAEMYDIPRPAVVLNAPSIATVGRTPLFSLREHCDVPEGGTLLVYVGVVHPARGTSQLVASLPHLPSNYYLALLGPRRPRYDDALLLEAEQHGVAERVRLLPPVAGALVPATLATADVSVIPGVGMARSYQLAMPNKLFESVMAGVPLAVSSLRPEQARFVRDNELGVVFDPLDPQSLGRELAGFESPPGLVDPDRLQALRERYSWEAQASVLERLYASISA